VVREALRARGKDFQSVDIAFGDGPTVITGANMGGKTVLLKSVALAQTLFQFGFYLPAAEATVAPVDEVLTSIGDAQDEMSGLSSFAAEMMRLDHIIGRVKAGSRALVLVDEPARTTNPTEGEAIVNALVELLAAHHVAALVTSHYSGIRADAKRLRVKGFSEDMDGAETKITAANIQDYMDYSLVPDDGRAPREALRIARILGVDEELTARAACRIKSEE
jgi:DNA mismatch repair ATPase MutS